MPPMWSLLFAALAWAAPPSTDTVVLLTQGNAVCSGAFISEDTIATAYHCVLSGRRVHVQTADGRQGWALVQATNLAWDQAVLKLHEDVEWRAGTWLEIREDRPEPGDTVYTIGHPYGAAEVPGFLSGTLRFALSIGEVSVVGNRAVQFTTPVNPGNSGGPVIDEDGRLVAVVSRRIKGDGLGFGGLAEGIVVLLDEPNGMSPIGGTAHLDAVLSTWDARSLALGAVWEVNLRDRVVLGALFAQPIAKRWDAVQLGSVEWMSAEIRGGLRQRFFRSSWTMRVDLIGGMCVIETFNGGIDMDTGLVFTSRGDVELAPMGAIAVQTGQMTIDFGIVPTSDHVATRLLLRYAFPGRIAMF